MKYSIPCLSAALAALLGVAVCALVLLVSGVAWNISVPQVLPPQAVESPAFPTPIPQIKRPVIEGQPAPAYTGTLQTLEENTIPVRDLRDLAMRLKGRQDIPATLASPASYYQVGDVQEFWLTDVDTTENFKVQATLQYVTDHLYFWVQDGVPFQKRDVQKLAKIFEEHIYPTDHEFFGSEWTPGVDGDPHLYVLYGRGLGSSIAGYFSSADEYTPLAHQYSNAHEMFVLSADHVDLGEDFAYNVLAHEFQHMIHWYRDRNEETWMNEGFSELAAFLNGYGVGGMDEAYVKDPDIQLTYWPEVSGNSTPYYGASFLFLNYFLNRFGEDATKALVANQENGMISIDEVLAQESARDPLTGKVLTADDVFADWVVASYLQNEAVGDGRYTYQNYPDAPRPDPTEEIQSCPLNPITRDVHQYGVDYLSIRCRGDYTLHFEGSTQVGVLPADPHSGSYAFWSNQGDESDMTLSRSFDFSKIQGPLTLKYWTWYNLEKDYDYVYLEASTDGKNWQILKTPSGTAANPSGNSYGWGYNANSGGREAARWIKESVDLSQYAGQKVSLRFEYVTDGAVNGEGLLLDDISIPETGYSSDFESGNGGWDGQGFVRIQNELPQTYRLEVIEFGRPTGVQNIVLSGSNTADIPLHFDSGVNQVVLAVSGTTRFTRQAASYRISIEP